ncbi:hypothetical protein P171DRAFT_218226 [Karstenula rhodostoma CBS 690.94]|uniref:Secreted protein n=1 Tax=Karstenula rhodostoma CBS 690.94 TaxID=1392251 RepID=A0A9P4PSZ7_9PLEO|nr:hypothetical protein P171DRAFT_218226 [Karstenula rhodostoma CBS 690.94]
MHSPPSPRRCWCWCWCWCWRWCWARAFKISRCARPTRAGLICACLLSLWAAPSLFSELVLFQLPAPSLFFDPLRSLLILLHSIEVADKHHLPAPSLLLWCRSFSPFASCKPSPRPVTSARTAPQSIIWPFHHPPGFAAAPFTPRACCSCLPRLSLLYSAALHAPVTQVNQQPTDLLGPFDLPFGPLCLVLSAGLAIDLLP